ncbi:MAG: SDR family oxidoreductase, partial [Clostridiales bacterium]|nr:SDR family oxidoreductase [Clostridiales bacterium]
GISVRKRVLITGSTQGIGKALAIAFVKAGYQVCVHCSKDLEKAERVRAEIGAHQAVVCDLSNMDEVNELYQKTGAVDCLILNASVQYKELWQDITDETFDKQFDVNVKSTLKLMQAYYPAMKENGFGRIVTIGSVNQYRNHSELSVYSATKCAVMKFVEIIAKQVAPFGVTVNNVSPGAIATPRNESVYNDEEKRKAVEKCIPMGRFGTPEDCVGAVLMLCSEQGNYITGTDIIIDGGMRL